VNPHSTEPIPATSPHQWWHLEVSPGPISCEAMICAAVALDQYAHELRSWSIEGPNGYDLAAIEIRAAWSTLDATPRQQPPILEAVPA
jgi:hypothetical protein